MAMARLSDPTPRMTLPRALLSEALRLARSPLTAVHLVCGLAAGLACGEYFSVTRWDPALGADAYAQFLGSLMPLMSAIVCGLAVDEERAAGRLANLTAVPSRGRARHPRIRRRAAPRLLRALSPDRARARHLERGAAGQGQPEHRQFAASGPGHCEGPCAQHSEENRHHHPPRTHPAVLEGMKNGRRRLIP